MHSIVVSSYLGMILALVAPIEYVVRVFARSAPYSTRGYDGLVLFGAGIAWAAHALVDGPLWAAVVASLAAACWLFFSRWMLTLPAAKLAARVGDVIPDFSARTTDGAPFSRADLAERAPAILVLYRGKW